MKWLAILLAIIVGLAAIIYFVQTPNGEPGNGATSTPQVSMLSYESDEHGISFRYPNSYILEEYPAATSTSVQNLHTVVLMDRVAAANIPEGGEGPPSMTIEVYTSSSSAATSTAATSTAELWIRNTPQSNFALSVDETISQVSVAGTTGYSYTWDGLYRGRSVVIAHEDRIIVASVTMLEPTDAIVSDFNALLLTLAVE